MDRSSLSLSLEECNADAFNSEIVMECMKRTNDLHTTQQCLMLLSKGGQLFPIGFREIISRTHWIFSLEEKLISMIMAMFAFVGDRLVRQDDLYSYQGDGENDENRHSFALQSEWIAMHSDDRLVRIIRRRMRINVDRFWRKSLMSFSLPWPIDRLTVDRTSSGC
jgi:hypothetical protein